MSIAPTISKGSTRILGISAFYHDCCSRAPCRQPGCVAATSRRNDLLASSTTTGSRSTRLNTVCANAGYSPADLDYVGFYDKPLAKFDRLIETYVAFAPKAFKSWMKALPLWLKSKLHLQREMDRAFRDQYRGRYVFADHHASHTARAFFPSPFEEAAVLTLDGVGRMVHDYAWLGPWEPSSAGASRSVSRTRWEPYTAHLRSTSDFASIPVSTR